MNVGLSVPLGGGVGVKLLDRDKAIHIPSLHIKAACKDDKIEEGTEDDCATQRRQFEILDNWVQSLPEKDGVILAGDFNRKLFDQRDSIKSDFFESRYAKLLPAVESRTCWSKDDYTINFRQLKAQAHENNPELDKQGIDARIYSPVSNQKIDFIIHRGLENLAPIESTQVNMTGSYRFENPGSTIQECDGVTIPKFKDGKTALVFGEAYPGDHCPIVARFSSKSK